MVRERKIRVFLGPSLSEVDQIRRSGGLIQTRCLTCEVASLDRAGGSAAPYLSLESAEEALPGPLCSARPGPEPPLDADCTTNTAPETLQLTLLFNRECCITFVFLVPRPGRFAATDPGCEPAPAPVCFGPHVERRVPLQHRACKRAQLCPCTLRPLERYPTAVPFLLPKPEAEGWRDSGRKLRRGVFD